MKLGEIKIEALKLMFASDGFSPKISELSELSNDENFKFYLAAMNGSINRCLSVFESSGVVPPKYVNLLRSDGVASNGVISFDLDALDISSTKILSVSKNIGVGLQNNKLDFCERNGILNVEQFGYGEIIVKYLPKITRVTDDTEDSFEIDLPEGYLNMMAHFIKGELYVEDEPELARQSREIFDKFLNGLHDLDASELHVKTIYSQTEM